MCSYYNCQKLMLHWFILQVTYLCFFVCLFVCLFVCFLGKKNSSQNYVWIYEYRTWTEAQSYCREKYTDLASVRNETERQQILNVTLYRDYVWIGLYRNRLWSDQSNSSFTYWLPWTQGFVAQPDNGVSVPGQLGSQHCTAVNISQTEKSCFSSRKNLSDKDFPATSPCI
uniref:C-type lectin domain-containing protein n=1 Tax=Cyprinus carpio TaxID=7962 RepID=A0A8C1ZW15_CYPCA